MISGRDGRVVRAPAKLRRSGTPRDVHRLQVSEGRFVSIPSVAWHSSTSDQRRAKTCGPIGRPEASS
jgi:hypothetical protein